MTPGARYELAHDENYMIHRREVDFADDLLLVEDLLFEDLLLPAYTVSAMLRWKYSFLQLTTASTRSNFLTVWPRFRTLRRRLGGVVFLLTKLVLIVFLAMTILGSMPLIIIIVLLWVVFIHILLWVIFVITFLLVVKSVTRLLLVRSRDGLNFDWIIVRLNRGLL